MSEHMLIPPADRSVLPSPDTDGEFKLFWEGAARGDLMIQECKHCGARQFYPRVICKACGEEPGWLKASGRGTVYTFSIVRQSLIKPFDAIAPYVVAMIDLEEGVRMMTNIIGCDLAEVKIGMPVKVRFFPGPDGVCLPYWEAV